MSRVITFSRFFPVYHPRKGQQTYFVEKLWKSLYGCLNDKQFNDLHPDVYESLGITMASLAFARPKHHTIRAGNRWKVGDKFSPRVWSGKPYASKQIIIAPDIEIKKVWDFEMDENGVYSVDGFYFFGETIEETDIKTTELAKNDGLTQEDMFSWFMPNYNKPKAFKGQIICWNENINY